MNTQIKITHRESSYLFSNTVPVPIASLRFILILCMLSTVTFKCMAQQNEGVIHYRVTEDSFKIMCSMEFYNKANLERDKNSYSSYISTIFTDLYFNSQCSKYAEQRDDATTQKATELFFSLNLLKRTMLMITPISDKHYVINDSLHAPEWNIMNDIKEIAGHICSGATTYDSVRKQKVKAWFALDIPISIGPDRWHGLPGAILEADLNDGAVVITTEKIEYCKLTTQLDTPKKPKGQLITQKKYNDLFKKIYARSTGLRQGYYFIAPY